jgi:hypothetical protein
VRIPYHSNFIGTTVVERPLGYLVSADVAAKLAGHGFACAPATSEPRDVEVATVTGYDREGGRKILEAAEIGEAVVAWQNARRAPLPGMHFVPTSGRDAAIAVYLCEPESDDGAIENGLVAPPSAGAKFPIWRVRS